MIPDKDKKWSPWTAEDTARLLSVGETGKNREFWIQVAAAFPGRGPDSCRQRFYEQRRKAKGHIRKPQVKDRGRNGRRIKTAEDRATMQPPLAAQPHHKNLTAAIFGDPLPGRSALDQRGSRA